MALARHFTVGTNRFGWLSVERPSSSATTMAGLIATVASNGETMPDLW